LGIDSLRWITLTLEMQDQLGIPLSETDLTRVINVRDLVCIAVEAATRSTERGAEARAALTPEQQIWLEQPSAAYRLLGVFLYAVNRFVMRFYFGVTVHGAQSIPRDIAVIVAPNHSSYLDPLALAAALRLRTLRHTVWAGWTGKLFTGPVSRAFSRAAQVVPVDPDRGPAAGLAFGHEILRRRKTLVWFPEGRRSPTGKLLRFLPGIGVLVKDTGATVIPVRISGTFEALPLFRAVPHRHRISVAFGAPMSGAELEAMGEGEDSYSRIADGLRSAVAGLPTNSDR
jgi:long-chain acyl-CoA synthetase